MRTSSIVALPGQVTPAREIPSPPRPQVKLLCDATTCLNVHPHGGVDWPYELFPAAPNVDSCQGSRAGARSKRCSLVSILIVDT